MRRTFEPEVQYELKFFDVETSSSRGSTTRLKQALIIEDNTETLIELVEISQNAGFRTQTSCNYNEAKNFLREEQVELLICEIEIAVSDSFSFLQEIRKNCLLESTPVVAFSRTGMVPEIHCLAAGADMYCAGQQAQSLLPSQIELLMEYAKTDALAIT